MDKVYDVILVWLNNHTRKMAKAFLFLFSVFVLLSCSHGKYDFDFKSADQALRCYQSLCSEMKGKKSITSKEAVPVLQEWHEVRDTVLSFLQKDSAYYAHSWIPGKYSSIDDSIRFHLLNTMLEQNYSLKDVAIIKRGSSIFIDDKRFSLSFQGSIPLHYIIPTRKLSFQCTEISFTELTRMVSEVLKT